MKNLIGFLDPDGVFTECEAYEHLELAKGIVQEKFQRKYISGIKSEELLFENGYIEFNSRGVSKRFIIDGKIVLLTNEQKDFIINNLKNANNSDQLKLMEKMLQQNDDLAERSILSYYEKQYDT